MIAEHHLGAVQPDAANGDLDLVGGGKRNLDVLDLEDAGVAVLMDADYFGHVCSFKGRAAVRLIQASGRPQITY